MSVCGWWFLRAWVLNPRIKAHKQLFELIPSCWCDGCECVVHVVQTLNWEKDLCTQMLWIRLDHRADLLPTCKNVFSEPSVLPPHFHPIDCVWRISFIAYCCWSYDSTYEIDGTPLSEDEISAVWIFCGCQSDATAGSQCFSRCIGERQSSASATSWFVQHTVDYIRKEAQHRTQGEAYKRFMR